MLRPATDLNRVRRSCWSDRASTSRKWRSRGHNGRSIIRRQKIAKIAQIEAYHTKVFRTTSSVQASRCDGSLLDKVHSRGRDERSNAVCPEPASPGPVAATEAQSDASDYAKGKRSQPVRGLLPDVGSLDSFGNSTGRGGAGESRAQSERGRWTIHAETAEVRIRGDVPNLRGSRS